MAQTFPTHVVCGALIAQTSLTFHVFQQPDIPWYLWWCALWFVGIAGAITPDVVMVPMFLYDKFVRHIQPMTQQGPVTMALKEISHSLPVWGSSLLVTTYFVPAGSVHTLVFLFLVSGLIGGILPDIPTHSEDQYRETDCTFLYPLNWLSECVCGVWALRWPNDQWEYRIGHGILWPLKRWERNINIVMVTSILGMWIFTILIWYTK